ncbi:MAG TPA: hypothetical protein VFN53_11510 [Acidobacteriaceae bacterium]|nr:hypothetical protein [Acidobacteriaceae bacterium]
MTTYQEQAEELLRAMKLLMEDIASYKSAVALLAVHSAIAFNDAVSERLTGIAHKGQDHSTASRKTRSACVKNKIDTSGIKHLDYLLSKKNEYSYSGIVGEKKSQDAALNAQRFASWAYRTVLQRESVNA